MKKETGEPTFSTKTSPKAEPALLQLFTDGIKDIYWAEKPPRENAAKNDQIRHLQIFNSGFIKPLRRNQNACNPPEQVFGLLGEQVQAQKCDAMEGISKEGEGIVESTEAGTATRDVGIILASQKVEHYEIATYGGLHQLAITLGLNDVAELLAETLAEEKAADLKLTEVAEADINYKAADEQ